MTIEPGITGECGPEARYPEPSTLYPSQLPDLSTTIPVAQFVHSPFHPVYMTLPQRKNIFFVPKAFVYIICNCVFESITRFYLLNQYPVTWVMFLIPTETVIVPRCRLLLPEMSFCLSFNTTRRIPFQQFVIKSIQFGNIHFSFVNNLSNFLFEYPRVILKGDRN